jgi:hypothetical protein
MATLTNLISNATGNVGIGTTSTDAKLQVYSTTGTTQIFNQLQLTNMGVGNNGDIVGIGFAAGESTQYGVKGSIGFVRTTSYGRGDITFYTNNTAANESVSTSNERMRITSGGTVQLNVLATYGSMTYEPSITYKQSGATGVGGIYFGNSYNSNNNVGLQLRVSNDGTQIEALTINHTGNVGIGTTSPSTKFDVFTNGTTNYISNRSNGTDGSIQGLIFVGGSYNRAIITSVNEATNGGYLAFQTYTGGNGAEVMRITSAGNVLVGRTSGGLTNATGVTISQSSIGMQTEGNAAQIIMNRTTSDGTIVEIRRNNIAVGTISVTTTATAYNTSSDYRLKESIKPLNSGLARVNALKPSVYNWKSDGSNGEGFLAHELAEVVPLAVTGQKDAVNDDGSINPQSVDLSKVVPILVAAIQELTKEMELLKYRL